MVAFWGSFFVIVSCTVLVAHGAGPSASCAAHNNNTAACLAVQGCDFCPDIAVAYNSNACFDAANCSGTCYDFLVSKCVYDVFGPSTGYPAAVCAMDATGCPGAFNSWGPPICCAKQHTCCQGHYESSCCAPGFKPCGQDGGGTCQCCKEGMCGSRPGTCTAE